MKRLSARFVVIYLLAAALALAGLPAAADVHYQAVTTTAIEGKKKGGPKIEVEAWVSGEKARVEFKESGNPMLPAGNYLLTHDGGRTLLLVNPKEKTYARWDLEAMLRMVGGMMQAMGGLVSLKVTQPQVAKLLDEDGGTLAGLPTRHYRWRTTYDTEVKVFGMKQASSTETLQDVWVTQELGDEALGVWLRKDPPKLGDPEFDRLIEAEIARVPGFPLKTVTVSTTLSGKKRNKEQVTTTTMEVVALDRSAVAEAKFVLPPDYRQVEMMPAMEQQEEGEGNPFKGLFGRDDDG